MQTYHYSSNRRSQLDGFANSFDSSCDLGESTILGPQGQALTFTLMSFQNVPQYVNIASHFVSLFFSISLLLRVQYSVETLNTLITS